MSSISLFPFVSGRLLTGSLCVLSLLFSLSGCNGDELLTPDVPAVPGGSGHELAEGELCNVSLSVTGIPSIEEATTRAIPEGKHTVLMDFTNHELTSREGREAGWISTEVRTEFGEEERAATRAIPADKMFKDGSKFRMLVFKGPYSGTVNMETPVANMICQVNGSSAKFLSPSTSLGLLKGRYTFICFPADEKFNTWKVGEPRSKSKVTVSNDDDFVYCKVENKDMNTSSFNLSLNFTRKCYKLTVKLLVAEELGYIVGVDTVPVTVGNPSGVGYPIVSNATCDLYDGTMSGHKNELIESRIPVLNKGVIPQSFGSVDNMLVAPATGSTSKLRIGYPQITVLKPKGTDGSVSDSIFTIKAGFITTEDAFTFEANKSYTITLSIGEQVKGIRVGGVLWAPGNLDYNATTKKYFWAPTPNKAKNAREARGAYFRWFAPLPQSSSNTSSANPISTSWSVTIPKWSGNSSNLGNYNGYYKTIFNNSSLTSGTLPSNLTETSLGDPCWGMGEGWRMPTYNELYLLCYVSPNATPSGTFTTGRNHLKNFSGYSGSFNDNTTTEAARYAGIFITSSSKPNDNPAAITNMSQYNGSQLFLPAAGLSTGSSVNYTGTYGLYWSSTPHSGNTGNSWPANFTSGSLSPSYYSRSYGFSVRCVLGDD